MYSYARKEFLEDVEQVEVMRVINKENGSGDPYANKFWSQIEENYPLHYEYAVENDLINKDPQN